MAKIKTPVTLKVKDFKDREVASLTYTLNQAIDRDGQVADVPRGGLIVLRMKALNDGNTELFNWMVDQELAKDGVIEFMNSTDTAKKMKDIQFYDAYCVNFSEHWEDDLSGGYLAHWEEITISCRKITIEKVSYVNDWTMRRDEEK